MCLTFLQSYALVNSRKFSRKVKLGALTSSLQLWMISQLRWLKPRKDHNSLIKIFHGSLSIRSIQKKMPSYLYWIRQARFEHMNVTKILPNFLFVNFSTNLQSQLWKRHRKYWLWALMKKVEFLKMILYFQMCKILIFLSDSIAKRTDRLMNIRHRYLKK